jgi:hypothetical protein
MQSLTKFLLAALLIAGTSYSYATPHSTIKINASGVVDRHLSGFHEIDLGGPFNV